MATPYSSGSIGGALSKFGSAFPTVTAEMLMSSSEEEDDDDDFDYEDSGAYGRGNADAEMKLKEAGGSVAVRCRF